MIPLSQLRPYTSDVVAPSPNQSARWALALEAIVLHATTDRGHEVGYLSWLRSPESRTSCHLLISRGGRVIRLVGDRQCSWRMGKRSWRGVRDVGSVALAIDIANRNDGEPYTDAQYGRAAEIVAHYCRQGLTLDDVVGQGEIIGGEADPLGWDWERFRAMVRGQLRATTLDATWPVYDRRSAERRAAEEAATRGAEDTPPQADAMLRAEEEDIAALVAPKPAHRSRTLWLNGLTVLAATGMMVDQTMALMHSVGLSVPRELTTWALLGLGVINIVLRLQTGCAIGGECDRQTAMTS